MASKDLVTEQFQFLGIDATEDVVSKCVELCNEYDIDAESFVEQWMAFTLSNLNGAAPSLEHLALLERKEFSTKRDDSLVNTTGHEPKKKSLTVYGACAGVDDQSDIDTLSNYVQSTPKRIKTEINSASHSELRPATYSPTVSHSEKYASRTNANSVIHSYGDEELLDKLTKQNDLNLLNLNINVVPNDDGETYKKAMFGFELLHEKASTFDNHIRYLSQYIMKKHKIDELSSVRHKTQTEIAVAARIECDADARLNPKCVVLQGTWDKSLSQTIPVDLEGVNEYSLFPGQVVVMKGVNPRGDRFIAKEVICDASLPLADQKADLVNCLTGTISIVAVAGPYTTSDNLSYDPLKDLVTYINGHKPNLVIMTGPFVDSEHAKVKDNTMAETYKSFFEKLMDSLGELASSSPNTKIIIISSAKDAFHVNIYPTPAYSTRKKYANITLMADPCVFNVNGIVIGATSVDALMQISQEEISKGMGGDKLARLANLMISQQSFSPLWPPPSGQSVDAALWGAHAHMSVTPHLLILPSNFRYFIKEVNGCVVINPERLSKGMGGGTFARVSITPKESTPLHKSIAAQIVRI